LSFASISSVPAAMAWRTLFLSANADGLMLGDDRIVLNGHLPAGEVDHATVVGDVPGVTGCLEQRHV